MTYDQLTPDIREIAEQHLPPLQLEAWVLWLEAKSMRPERGIRWIAQQLDLDPSSVEGRLQRAKRNLHRAGIYQDINGNWHHTPPTSAQDATQFRKHLG